MRYASATTAGVTLQLPWHCGGARGRSCELQDPARPKTAHTADLTSGGIGRLTRVVAPTTCVPPRAE
eukprot:7382385-Prymnesium_polylepis.2